MGFVTNSSSSSFIVAFDKVPNSWEEVLEMLFDADKATVSEYDLSMGTKEVAQIVFDDISKQTPNNLDELKETFSGFYDGIGKYKDYKKLDKKRYDSSTQKEKEELYDKLKVLEDEFEEIHFKKFLEENKGKQLYSFSYSDNDGDQGTLMEHGGIFENLPHVRISRH
jgi:predicted ribosome quality control (RQC) complex YloA/Tae2 family protein